MSAWPESVGRVVDGETTFSSDSLGVIVDTLTERTNWLKLTADESRESFVGSKGFSFYDTGFSPECEKGMLVAWDSGTGVYIPALARGTGEYREDGTEIPASSANVIGVLLEKTPSTTGGTVLCCGYNNDPDIIDKLTGGSPTTGNYYLSSEEPGSAYSAAFSENPMSPYCFTYLYSAGNKTPAVFIRPYPPAYNGTSEVQSVEVADGGGLLTSVTEKGRVQLNLNTKTVETNDVSGFAVVRASAEGLVVNPVVNTITAGAGISAVSLTPGNVTISNTGSLLSEHDINLCALNGVYVGTSDTNGIVYTFPAGVDSSLTGIVRVPHIPSAVRLKLAVNILLEGNGSTSGLSSAYVTIQPTTSDENAKATPISYSLTQKPSKDTSKVYRVTKNIEQSAGSDDLIYIKLLAKSPTATTKVLAVSVVFVEVVNEQQ